MTLLELMQRAREAPASLDALARAASVDPDGRPSDAVREHLRVHPARATARGDLLARARAVMLENRHSKGAHLPTVPTRIARRDAAAHGYPQLRSDREPWLSTPLLAMEAFSGGGLFSLASALEGNIEVDDCEWSKAAVATRAANKGLLRLAFDPVPKDARAWRPSTRTPDGLDLLFGGPPCSPFSKGADLGRDKRDRGWLAADNFFPLALDWMVDLQPRVVAWENAPTLVERPEYVRWLAAWRAQARVAGYEGAPPRGGCSPRRDAGDPGHPCLGRAG